MNSHNFLFRISHATLPEKNKQRKRVLTTNFQYELDAKTFLKTNIRL